MEIGNFVKEELQEELNKCDKILKYLCDKENKSQKDCNRIYEIIGEKKGIKLVLSKLGYYCSSNINDNDEVKWKITKQR